MSKFKVIAFNDHTKFEHELEAFAVEWDVKNILFSTESVASGFVTVTRYIALVEYSKRVKVPAR